MGVGRWIGGFFGFMSGGPLGALAGYAIGWLFEKGAEGFSGADNVYNDNRQYGGYTEQQQYEGARSLFPASQFRRDGSTTGRANITSPV